MTQNGHVLIVEDDSDLADITAIVLRGAGYEPEIANNGAEALERLRVRHPRVILLDLMMPEMNGWEFRNAQLRDPALAAIPVVVMTADGHANEKAASLGAEGYLRKPVDLDELLEKVSRYGA